jgi:hypothetical protein
VGCERTSSPYVLRSLNGKQTEATEDDLGQPFAVEIGAPLVDGPRVWLPFAESGGRSARAGVLQVQPTLTESALHEFDAAVAGGGPPRVVAVGANLVLAALVTSGKTRAYRLGMLTAGQLTWGHDVADPGAADDSTAFDLKASRDSVGLVFDTWDLKLRRGRIAGVFFSTDALQNPLSAKEFGLSGDAESPRLLPRPGGFWLTWITHVKSQTAQAEADAPELAGESYVTALPLGFDGSPSGEERALTPIHGFARSYDLAAGHGGAFLLAWRDEPGVSGVEGGAVYLAQVSEQGAGQPGLVAAPGPLAGTAPSLVFDSNPGGGAPHGWLSLESEAGGTWLGALSPEGTLLGPLHGDTVLGAGALLAASGGRLLVAEPRAQDLQLQWMSCPAVNAASDAGLAGGR